MSVSPLKYYLARAVYDWTLDNALTPHVIADAEGNHAFAETYEEHLANIDAARAAGVL